MEIAAHDGAGTLNPARRRRRRSTAPNVGSRPPRSLEVGPAPFRLGPTVRRNPSVGPLVGD